MLETIGRLGSCTISDLLPDRPLVSPSPESYTRSGKHVRVGLYAYICPACGKRFEATLQHRYKTVSESICRMYCSYKCFRPAEKAMEDKFKADCLGFVAVSSRDKPPLERAQIRLEKCKRKINEICVLRNDPEKWNAMTKNQRANKMSSLNEWRRKLDEAQESLEVLKAYENA